MSEAEYVVLVDDSGTQIGIEDKALVHHSETPLHLAFSCYVFDADAQLLLTRRARHKATFPGVRTNTCCGHPGPGESMRDAVTRRLKDELGIVPDSLDLILPRFRYRAVMADGTVENELCPVFRAVVRAGTAPDPNPAEVDSAWWEPWSDVGPGLRAGAEISPWAALQIAELDGLGVDPAQWPTGSDADLPPAAIA